MTTIINIKKTNLNVLGYKDFNDWNKNDNHVYIGRNMSFYVPGTVESKWKNRFSVKKYGRDKCLEKYREYIMSNVSLMNDIEIRGL